jgi:hypothetical protein
MHSDLGKSFGRPYHWAAILYRSEQRNISAGSVWGEDESTIRIDELIVIHASWPFNQRAGWERLGAAEKWKLTWGIPSDSLDRRLTSIQRHDIVDQPLSIGWEWYTLARIGSTLFILKDLTGFDLFSRDAGRGGSGTEDDLRNLFVGGRHGWDSSF